MSQRRQSRHQHGITRMQPVQLVVYGPGYQDEEQKKMEERTRLCTQRQVGKRTPD